MSVAPRHFSPIDFKTRLPALDGIRALAITLVFAEHFGGRSPEGVVLRLINLIRQRGWVGVDLFFVLSGFLITGILYDTREDSHFFKRFFARRAIRIFPVFYTVAILLLLLTPIFHYQWHWLHLTFLIYMGNLSGIYNFHIYTVHSANHPVATAILGHFWSLCVEEQFYLLWPLAVWLIRDRFRLLWTAAGISALALVLRVAMIRTFGDVLAETWIIRILPFRMDALLIGAILALLLRGPAADRWQRSGRWFFLAGSAATLAIFILSPAGNSPWLLSIGLTCTALASAGLIASALRPGSPAFRLFTGKPLRTLGRYSYGFYVYHLLFRMAWIRLLVFLYERMHSLALAGIIGCAVNFAAIFLVSKLSYDLIEVRFLRLKRSFEYDSEATDRKHAFST
ncbi:MAG TPA: acyltransferase [Granulicella sp.]|jgi:peptidoglycan/LPS O-acetylase OafA/YrhL|nr:acyltransferase [Granulicella sp.]